MSRSGKHAARFRVGDWVTLPYGPKRALAQVIEDRGRLGFKGERLYRIRLNWDMGEASAFEVGEECLSPAAKPDEKGQTPGVS